MAEARTMPAGDCYFDNLKGMKRVTNWKSPPERTLLGFMLTAAGPYLGNTRHEHIDTTGTPTDVGVR